MFFNSSNSTSRSNLDDAERDDAERDNEDTDCVDNKDGILPTIDDVTQSDEGGEPPKKRTFQNAFDQDITGASYGQDRTANQATVATIVPFGFEHDADSMFLLSLLPTFKRVKPENRIDAQIEILNVLKNWTSGPSHTET